MTDLTDEAVKALLDQYERYTTGKDGMTLSAETTGGLARALLEARAENASLRADAQAAVAVVVEEAADVDFPDDWRDERGLKEQRHFGDGFSACRDAIRDLAPVDGLAMVDALRKERDDALDAARQQDALRGATLATMRSVSADLAAAQAQIEALRAILHDAGALRDAADRVSEWFCTEARHLEGPRIQALRMAMVAYDRHMQPTALPVPNFSAGWLLEEDDGSIIVGAARPAKEGE